VTGRKRLNSDAISSAGGRRAVGASSEPGGDSVPPSRKRPAQMGLVDIGNRSIIVFLTVCAKDRKTLFAQPDIHEVLVSSWEQATRWRVGRYVIMPNHIHLFCAPAVVPPEPVRAWVKYWKTLVSRDWPRPADGDLWQQDCWDTQLRRGENYAAKWEYVRRNPVRAGLAQSADDWPYQGELNVLMWHDR